MPINSQVELSCYHLWLPQPLSRSVPTLANLCWFLSTPCWYIQWSGRKSTSSARTIFNFILLVYNHNRAGLQFVCACEQLAWLWSWEQMGQVGAVWGGGRRSELYGKQPFIQLLIRILIEQSMPERKIWSQEEDRVLKFLREVRGVDKWSLISETMQKEFNISGRNGKQCRERYHNHLDKSITNTQWTLQEDNKLFQIQDEVGNKWALISSRLPGRSENCVKNHFYSKLRKALRKLNKKIQKHFRRQYKEIKTATLYKIIDSTQNKGKGGVEPALDYEGLTKRIKHQMTGLETRIQLIENQQQQLDYIRRILEDIALCEPEIKKGSKKNGPRSAQKVEDEDSPVKSQSNKVSSTKSLYDEQEQSEYSNSELYSSSSYGHSFRSIRSQGLLKPYRTNPRENSMQSQSEDEQNSSTRVLYKSANSLTTLKQQLQSEVKLFASLKLPIISTKGEARGEKQSISSENSHESGSRRNQKIFQCGAQNMDMIGDEENFPTYMKMRLFSPKKPSHDDIMEMNEERDDIFYGERMEIDCEHLVQQISGLRLHDMPKLGHAYDL